MKAVVNGKVVDIEATETVIELTAEEKQRQYGELVENLIRRKYSVGAELAILRQKDTKYCEYHEYYEYAEQCKAEAKEILGIEALKNG